jgi:hypothetical protein
MKGLSKAMETAILDNQCQGRDSKQRPPAYISKESKLRQLTSEVASEISKGWQTNNKSRINFPRY